MSQVAFAMMQKNRGDIRRIEHSLKVYAYAHLLGLEEQLDADSLEILDLAALLHDIGIHVAERLYGVSTSHHQQVEGPPVAREILSSLGYPTKTIDRVCFIISRHHTFTAVDNIDFQLLVEADFLVNSTEDQMTDQQVALFAKNIFRSASGIACLQLLFPGIDL